MDVLELLHQNEHTELLRFITAGSVDDGKSTLIGRLLYEAKGVFEDQLASVRKASVRRPVPAGELDFSLFTDGLKAEREQNITIDVAYRYFATPRRKFIIADTPGHEQYTRNMVTGASTASLMVILIDATKGMLVQSKRHASIASLLGIQHIIVAVNKMDLVDYKQEVFDRIREEFTQFAAKLSARDVIFIPCSALKGDNIVTHSPGMPWYQGPTLLHHLETLHIAADRNLVDLRLPVQYVCRPDANFRGYMGTVASGIIRPGQEIMVLPSGERSRVKSLLGPDGEIPEAFPPMSCCVVLEDERDVSRGCMLVHPHNVPNVDTGLEAMLVWMGQEPLRPGHPYILKHTTRSVLAEVSLVRYRIDIQDLHRQNASALAMNEIGRVVIAANQTVAYDPYVLNRATGGFILLDRLANNTVGAGMILPRDPHQRTGAPALSDSKTGTPGSAPGTTRSARLPQWLAEAPETDREAGVATMERRLLDTGVPLRVLDTRHGDHPIKEHKHEFIELVLFAEGTSEHEYAGKRYTLTPGDLFIIHPGEPHAYISGKRARVYNCLFMPEILKPDIEYLRRMDGFFDLVMVEPFFRSETGLRSVLHLDAPTRVRVVEFLTEIQREVERKTPGYEAAARAMLIQLLVLVARFRATSNQAASQTDQEDWSGKRAAVHQCIRYVEEHYPEEIRLEKLADLAFLSPEYFSKVFKHLTSQTPIEFVNAVRMDKAKQLLASTELPITEIAFRTGFHDPNYFARQFKKVTGTTPGAYRKQSSAEGDRLGWGAAGPPPSNKR
jgi:bifunctional enzyme CysN/CysC